ncbi:MAG: TldD/PmbA family protein [Candidatus Thorarchaeota archaeon]|nr:MAG: TldD/PmbA family protein [Candidatus Thorarchaeota archaeon]
MRDELLNVGELAVKHAEKHGVTQAEAFVELRKSIEITVEDSIVRSVSLNNDRGCGLRSFLDRKTGYSYVTTLDSKDVLNAVESSIRLAKVATPDQHFLSLPELSDHFSDIRGLFDTKIESTSSDDASQLILRAVSACQDVLQGRNPKIAGYLRITDTSRAIANSLGIACFARSSLVSLELDATIRSGHDQANSFDEQHSCSVSGIDSEEIGRTAGERSVGMLGAKPMESGTMPVVLSPTAFGFLLKMGIAEALKASNVQSEQSFLQDHLGTEIGSDRLTLYDDGLKEGGIYSCPFDAEGTPSSKTPLIRKGVLESYLHDSYTANKGGVVNTGNAGRNTYRDKPGISSTNLVVTPGKGLEDELISEIRRGVLCRFSADRPDRISGDLSAVVMEGHFIENGEIAHPLSNTIFSINAVDLLRQIVRIGGDVEVTELAVSPTILVENVRVTSG